VDALNEGIAAQSPRGVLPFGVVFDKSLLEGRDLFELGFEVQSYRFDRLLDRKSQQFLDSQCNLIMFDKSENERRIQALARDFKYLGHEF
jgi:hypothetical protein